MLSRLKLRLRIWWLRQERKSLMNQRASIEVLRSDLATQEAKALIKAINVDIDLEHLERIAS